MMMNNYYYNGVLGLRIQNFAALFNVFYLLCICWRKERDDSLVLHKTPF